MSIKSTKYVTREWAIERILLVAYHAKHYQYLELQMITSETENNLPLFVDHYILGTQYTEELLSRWTDEMLGDLLDTPFYRESIFDNYLIREEQ